MKIPKNIWLPIVILLAGVLAVVGMVKLKPKASRSKNSAQPTTVEIITAQSQTTAAEVRSTGIVTASREVIVLPEVSGKIVYQSDLLIPGGRFEKGALIARIDSRDYSLASRQEKSRVRQAELELALEQNRQETAKREWKLLGDDRPEAQAALALRKPHLIAAEENLKAAQGNLDRAQLALARTSLRAPFNSVVVAEQIDIGQVVGPGSTIAKLIGTDRFRIVASVPVEHLGLLEIPGFNSESASTVSIVQNLGRGIKAVRHGKLVGLEGVLDAQTRTAQLLIALDNPMDPAPGEQVILYGAYVDLLIFGRKVENTFLIPRIALVEGRKVWVVNSDNRLASKDVTIGWGNPTSVAVLEGLTQGDRIVVTPLSMPVSGMQVSIFGENAPTDALSQAKESGDES